MRALNDTDRDESIKKALEDAEDELAAGRKEKALESFEKIREKTKKGLTHVLATQYVAFLKYEKGKHHETYELLKPIRSQLAPESLTLLHRAALDEKDYKLVESLGGECFQNSSTVDTALRNAYASAQLGKAHAAIGWIETAMREGLEHVGPILKEKSFDPIRDDPQFKKLQHAHP
jgi:hypothetical protein